MSKNVSIVKKDLNEDQKKDENKIDTMEELNEWVLDLSEKERQEQDTVKKISDVLQIVVDEQNKKAVRYKENFRNRVQEKLEHKIWKKYFPGKTKREILTQAQKDNKVREIWKKYENEIKYTNFEKNRKGKREVFEDIKRVFNKEITRHGWSDIDKEAGTYLLNLVHYFKDKNGNTIEYKKNEVEHGQRGKKWLTYDTGGTWDGLEVVPTKHTIQEGKHKGKESISLFNALAIIDEHDKKIWESFIKPKNITKPTSSTHIIYEILKELDIINKKYEDQIKRFVDFVDKADSKHYQFNGIDVEAKNRTLFSLHRNIGIEKIYNYFEDPKHTGFEVLKDEELAKLWIKNIEKHEQENNEKIEVLKNLEKQWRFGNLNGEKFIFAKGSEFSGGQIVTSYMNSWLFQIFKSGDLYMYHPSGLPSKISGFDTDGHFLIIKKIGLKDLEEILNKFDFWRDAEKEIKETFLNYRKELMKTEEEETEKNKEKENQKDQMKNNIDALEDLTIKELKEKELKGKEEGLKEKELKELKEKIKITGVINSIQNKNIHINLTPTITGMIKNETKEKTLMVGEKIEVNIKSITIGTDKNTGKHKRLISLEKTVS